MGAVLTIVQPMWIAAASAARRFVVDSAFWTWGGWTAVAAIATFLGAVGTVGALLFLWLQFAKLRTQLDLAQRQDLEAREAARPLLETSVWPANPTYFNIAISWVRGTQPAFDVEVWIRQNSGVYLMPYGTLPAQTRVPAPNAGFGIGVNDNGAVAADLWPFPETVDDEPLGANDFWAGILWRSEDQYRGRYLMRCRASEDPNAPPRLLYRYFVLVASHLDPPSIVAPPR